MLAVIVRANIFRAHIALRPDSHLGTEAEMEPAAVGVVAEIEGRIDVVPVGRLQLAVAVAALDVEQRHRADLRTKTSTKRQVPPHLEAGLVVANDFRARFRRREFRAGISARSQGRAERGVVTDFAPERETGLVAAVMEAINAVVVRQIERHPVPSPTDL